MAERRVRAVLDVVEDASPVAPPQPPAPSIGELLFALIRGIGAPYAAADCWARASSGLFVLLVPLLALFFTAFMLAYETGVDMAEFTVGPDPVTGRYVRTLTANEVWDDWLAAGAGAMTLRLIASAAPFLAASLLCAFLYLPAFHVHGRLLRSFRLSWRMVMSQAGTVLALTALVTPIFIYSWHWDKVEPWMGPSRAATLMLIGAPAALWIVIFRLERIAARWRERFTLEAHPPICEGCGYDLTAPSSEGRCPECGLAVARSIGETARSGVEWQRSAFSFGLWLRTTLQIVWSPSVFYRELRVRDAGEESWRFALATFMRIALLGMCFALVFFATMFGPFLPLNAVGFMSAFALVSFPMMVWFGLRLGGAAVSASFFLMAPARDERWASSVIYCESAYLWMFAFWWAANMILIRMFDDYVAAAARTLFGWESIQTDRFFNNVFGIPSMPAVLFAVTIGLCVIWVIRARIAWRAVRWANR